MNLGLVGMIYVAAAQTGLFVLPAVLFARFTMIDGRRGDPLRP